MTRIDGIKERESKATGLENEYLTSSDHSLDLLEQKTAAWSEFYDHSRDDIPYLTKGMEAARPVMELLSKESCKYCDDVTMACAHVQAHAWKKEYYPEEKL